MVTSSGLNGVKWTGESSSYHYSVVLRTTEYFFVLDTLAWLCLFCSYGVEE